VLEAQLLGDRLSGLAQTLEHAPRVDGVDRPGRLEGDARAPGRPVEVPRAPVGARHPEVELELGERRAQVLETARPAAARRVAHEQAVGEVESGKRRATVGQAHRRGRVEGADGWAFGAAGTAGRVLAVRSLWGVGTRL
jgi:hypothetical protein